VSEDTHITHIEKVGQGDAHAMHVKGVVDGRPVEGLITVKAFEDKERQGTEALREFLRDGLGALHEQAQERRR
jgi:hypothetical protein